MTALVINAGSSTLKVSLFDVDAQSPGPAPAPLWEGEGAADAALETLLAQSGRQADIDVVGHRIVHGGDTFHQSVRITPEVRAAIARFGELAPEHNRMEAALIEAAGRIFGPGIPQVAAFDTSFHATLPRPAFVYPGPYEWLAQGIRRYGFHGISHQYVSQRAAAMTREGARMITCHLGNGCSLAAIRDGRSIATTMGYTPLDGLMMGTRSGSVDPGILIHLVRDRGYGADDLDRVLNRESGLKGISGISGDMRDVLAGMSRGDERAQLAFDIYTQRLAAGIAGLVPALGGLDVLVFTGGVGEHAAPVRATACATLGFLGVELDAAKNQAPMEDDVPISSGASAVCVLVVHTKEQWQIARECYRVMSAAV